MSTAIMQTGALGWDYKFYDWNDSQSDVNDVHSKVSRKKPFFYTKKCFYFSNDELLDFY